MNMPSDNMNWTETQQQRNMYSRMSGPSSEGGNNGISTQGITKHTLYNMKRKDPKLQAPFRKNVMISSKIWQNSKEGKIAMDRMKDRLILLWNASTYTNLRMLKPEQKKHLALWEHIVNCRDEDCKRTHCQSSCRVIRHFRRSKLLNQRSTCKLWGKIIKQIYRKSCINNHMTSKQYGTIQMERTKQIDSISIFDSGKNHPSTSYKPKRISKLASNSQTMTKYVEQGAMPQKRRCTRIRFSKSVKGGLGADSVVQAIKTKNTKNVLNKKMQNDHAMLSEIRSFPTGKYIFEEEQRQEIVDTSIALLNLKKRKWGNITTDTNSTPVKVAKIVCASNTERDYPKLIISPKTRYEKALLSDTGVVFTGRCILEEEEKTKRCSASIALLSLKKRTDDIMATDTNRTS